MLRWNFYETLDHVAHRDGDANLCAIRKGLESIRDRQRYAHYHFQEYRRLLSEHIDDRLTSKSIYEITFAFEPNQREELDLCLSHASANVVACVQSLHSLGDILAHVVYFALGLNTGESKLRERDVSLSSVARLLKQNPAFVKLVTIFDGILSDPEFVYLTALVNHSKHRSIVDPVLSVDPPVEGQPPYVLLFEAFTYDETPHPQHNIQSVLESTYDWLSQEIVECGNALNLVLLGESGSGSGDLQ